VVTDISQEKKAQAERRLLSEQLQRAQKMEALGTLAGGVAHDLNNILSGIVSYPDLLLMDLPADSPLRQPIESMKRSGQRAAAVVQDLLALACQGVMAPEVINLNTLIQEYLQSPECLKLGAEHPGVRIRTRLDEDLLNMEGTPVHLSNMIVNLLCNSAEAIDGAGEIVLSTANIHLDKTSTDLGRLAAGDYVRLRISDDGCGISEEDRERIFEPFYTRKKMGRSGTGLGMAVVWGTVADHKGNIELESHEGQGTTVTITLPATHTMATTPGEDEAEAYAGHRQTILVVDDQEAQRQLATQILKRLGYRAQAVESGEAALVYLETHSADLVLLDMIMPPGMDGLETLRRIRARTPDQAVILVSGYAQTDRVHEALDLGGALYLRKPYTVAKLSQAVWTQLLSN
jgi:CheY-like chemotaxis protein